MVGVFPLLLLLLLALFVEEEEDDKDDEYGIPAAGLILESIVADEDEFVILTSLDRRFGGGAGGGALLLLLPLFTMTVDEEFVDVTEPANARRNIFNPDDEDLEEEEFLFPPGLESGGKGLPIDSRYARKAFSASSGEGRGFDAELIPK